MNPKYLEVRAEPRYWEDATVNGVEDEDGSLIPFREGDLWIPVIDLDSGAIMDWPAGTEADIHYKVCDQGEYWLLDESKVRIAKWRCFYVPDDLLCPNDQGYGDYIILRVAHNGTIHGWEKRIIPDAWAPVEQREAAS